MFTRAGAAISGALVLMGTQGMPIRESAAGSPDWIDGYAEGHDEGWRAGTACVPEALANLYATSVAHENGTEDGMWIRLRNAQDRHVIGYLDFETGNVDWAMDYTDERETYEVYPLHAVVEIDAT
jgi:hypothetical protein